MAEPTSAATSALKLEAIGAEGALVLKRVLRDSNDPEVRFYAAEALAYLDESEAAEPLAEAARDERAFRWHALTALSTMDHVAAYDALSGLLHVSSAETRYGAFRAMRTRNHRDPTVAGEVLEERFALHLIDSTGEPMIHFTAHRRPEIVIFGRQTSIKPPAFLFAGKRIMIKGLNDQQVKVTRFEPGGDDERDQELIVSTRAEDVVKAVVQLGGTYGEVFDMFEQAKKGDYLEARLAVDARAERGREYRRTADGESDASNAAEEGVARFDVASPVPGLFYRAEDEPDRDEPVLDIDPETPDAKPGFFGKMKGWMSGEGKPVDDE